MEGQGSKSDAVQQGSGVTRTIDDACISEVIEGNNIPHSLPLLSHSLRPSPTDSSARNSHTVSIVPLPPMARAHNGTSGQTTQRV